MTSLIESKKICVTMFLLFALAILVNTLAGGTLPAFGSSPVLTPDVQQELQAEDSPFFPPDIELARVNTLAGGTQELLAEDSPFFPPDIELARVNTVAGGTQELLAEDSPFFPPDI